MGTLKSRGVEDWRGLYPTKRTSSQRDRAATQREAETKRKEAGLQAWSLGPGLALSTALAPALVLGTCFSDVVT